MNILSLFLSQNLDLLTLGITSAAIGILSFVVILHDRFSITNKALGFFAIITILHGIFNYLNYQVADPTLVLWLIRIVIFFAVWHSFSLFTLFYVFPERSVTFPAWFRNLLVPIVALTSVLTLTPYVFSGITNVGGLGQVSTPQPGKLIFVFVLVVIGLVASSLLMLFKKTIRSQGVARNQFLFVLLGTIISFALLITFELIFPSAFHDVTFVPYTALFMLPFVLFTVYSIIKYRLMNIKVIATEVIAFVLATVTLTQVILASTLIEKLFTSSVFLLTVFFGVLLIKSVVREVRQREEIEQLATNLSTANDKLKELDRLKSQFLSMASHDLRAPLTIIRNFISLLLDGSYGALAPAGQEGLKQVFDRATDMAKSVETYLDVSRIEQGKMKYDFVDIELVPLIKNAVMAFTPNAEKKGLKLSATYDPTLEGVKAKIDVSKMNEVLNNLLDNTIKYTPTGEMNLTVKRMAGVARISLKDTGVGMTEDTLKNLFQLFRPGEDSKRINPASTGVGLFVTKAHVEAHKGKVWAESEGVGKGSTFIMELPLLTA